MADTTPKRLSEQVAELEAELAQLKAERTPQEDIKHQILTSVSHELRTPLSIIKEAVSLLAEQGVGTLNVQQQKCINAALSNVNRLTHLINDLLDLSKIEAGKIEYKVDKLDLYGMVDELLLKLVPKAELKGVSLKSQLPIGLLAVKGDRGRLMQVLDNLINNAIRFTESGGHILITAREREPLIEIAVTDTGCGIKKEDFPRLFDKFQQINRTYGPGEKGTGLGLAISKQIVEALGGKIYCESEAGRGTTFRFTVPTYSGISRLS